MAGSIMNRYRLIDKLNCKRARALNFFAASRGLFDLSGIPKKKACALAQFGDFLMNFINR